MSLRNNIIAGASATIAFALFTLGLSGASDNALLSERFDLYQRWSEIAFALSWGLGVPEVAAKIIAACIQAMVPALVFLLTRRLLAGGKQISPHN